MFECRSLPNGIALSPPSTQQPSTAIQRAEHYLAATNAQANPQRAEAARLLARRDELRAHYESLTAEPTFTREP